MSDIRRGLRVWCSVWEPGRRFVDSSSGIAFLLNLRLKTLRTDSIVGVC